MTIKDVTSIDTVSRIVDLSLGIQEEFGLIKLETGDVWYVSCRVIDTVNHIIERDSITDLQAVVSLVWNKATSQAMAFTAERMAEQNR